MFEGCESFSSGSNLNISNFNTHNLQDMEAMFKDCISLQDLDLSSFSTNRVANMKELFSGCKKLHTHLYLDNFVISDGTIITDMCNDLCALQWSILPIYCSSGVEQKMSSSVTGLNTNYVTFYRPPHPTAK
jgi:surface protein